MTSHILDPGSFAHAACMECMDIHLIPHSRYVAVRDLTSLVHRFYLGEILPGALDLHDPPCSLNAHPAPTLCYALSKLTRIVEERCR